MSPAETRTLARVARWTVGALDREVERAIERLAATEDVRHLVVLPDVHLAEGVSIGTVIATTRLLYPAAVGGDIGCGMMALRFHGSADLLASDRAAARLLSALYDSVPCNRHPRKTVLSELPAKLREASLGAPHLESLRSRDGLVQFGTLGRGNHFLEFQADPEGTLWLMIHSGSRGMGQAIRDYHVERASKGPGGLHFLDAEAASGKAYLADVEWARSYAEANRRRIATAAEDVIRGLFGILADESSLTSCDHNHVQREEHFGEVFWVHRKGAIQASSGRPGIIPGSMGTHSYHVEGRGHDASLRSSSHGAGRALSRGDAFRAIPGKQLLREMGTVWFDHRQVEKLRDEAPSAYKDISLVMRAQGDLTRIVRRLTPILSYKGA